MHCELSGDSLANAEPGTVVVTPSGHLCRKALLLTKLTENGGTDPFDGRPLSEDDLITLHTKSEGTIPPRPLGTSSVPALLNALQQEYDAVVLELFDTRRLLTDTRQELSQALYQNDAALRVIARLTAERDAARQGQVTDTTTTADASAASSKKRKRDDDTTTDTDVLVNDMPEADLATMTAVWEKLHNGRKALMKELGATAPTADVLAASAWTTAPKGRSKASKLGTAQVWQAKAGSLLAFGATHWAQVTGDHGKQVEVYKMGTKKAVFSFESTEQVTAMDMDDTWILMGLNNGSVQVATVADGQDMTTHQVISKVGDSDIVDISLHYDQQHALCASAAGTVGLLNLTTMKLVARFTPPTVTTTTYTAAALHPDGLIYVTGTADGVLHLWDLKSKSLAATLGDTNPDAPVTAVQVSPNGYHIAAVSKAGVSVWDLRKQKVLATLTADDEITGVAFDPAAKWIVYSTAAGAVTAVPVKEWDRLITCEGLAVSSALAWLPEHGLVGAHASNGVVLYEPPTAS